MLNTLFLIVIIIGSTLQSVLKKPYTNKVGENVVYFYSMLVSLSAMLFFLCTAGKMTWSAEFLPYSFGFALAYILGTVGMIKAISFGALSLSSLVISYSLLLPAIYGLIFLHESVSLMWIFGIILLVISLFLINGGGKGEKITLKWVIWVLIGFFGNGMCTILQKMQQNACDGAYKNEFMIAALAVVAVFTAVMSLIKERKSYSLYVKAGLFPGVICGLLNGLVNLFVMLLGERMPIALSFPIISAGGILLTGLVSVTLYRERLATRQIAAILIGTVSVVLMNL